MKVHAICVGLTLAGLGVAAEAQTDEQSEESIAYLQKRGCAQWNGSGWTPETPLKTCFSDTDCSAQSYCRHRSDVEPKEDLYPELRFPEAPAGGSGEGTTRYVPLCEDGSGDHEYSLSDGDAGEAPNCQPQHFIRCADGSRPYYRVDAGSLDNNNWLIHAGGGGHASTPGIGSAIWTLVHTEGGGAYSVPYPPKQHTDLEGVFDEGAGNPFADYNRIWLEKCTPDRWLGNRAHHDLQDFLEPLTLNVVTGECSDSDGDGTANCLDIDCECSVQTIDPPKGPNAEYSVYYHGKRIVRAVVGEVLSGLLSYSDYPTKEDTFPEPDASSKFLFTCHSNGCNGLQNGHIDDLHGYIDNTLNADVDVRALFSSNFKPGSESGITVSGYDCVDSEPDGVPDNDGDIDDSRSVYEHTIAPRSISLQPMSGAVFKPGESGRELNRLIGWWDPSVPGYDEPVDASCLAQHCPARPSGWANEANCAPCNESVHVLLNHLATPLFYNQAQKDTKAGRSLGYCSSGGDPDVWAPCDVDGSFGTGINKKDTHWRKLVRKQMADLFRLGELERCEGGAGDEWPYDHMLLVAPNWSDHGGLFEANVAGKLLQLPSTGSPKPIGELARDWVDSTGPVKAICLTEKVAGENDLDFDDATKGEIEVCLESS